jgi:hypothetical protein
MPHVLPYAHVLWLESGFNEAAEFVTQPLPDGGPASAAARAAWLARYEALGVPSPPPEFVVNRWADLFVRLFRFSGAPPAAGPAPERPSDPEGYAREILRLAAMAAAAWTPAEEGGAYRAIHQQLAMRLYRVASAGAERFGEVRHALRSAWRELLGGSAPRRRRAGARTKLADAIGAQTRHPDWTYKELARHVGCTEQYLKNSDQLKALKEAIRKTGAAQHHRSGRARGAGNMDAYEAPRRGDEADVG